MEEGRDDKKDERRVGIDMRMSVKKVTRWVETDMIVTAKKMTR